MKFELDLIVKHDGKEYNVVGEAKVYRDYIDYDLEGFDGHWEWNIDDVSYTVFDEEDNDVTDTEVSAKLEDKIVETVFDMLEKEKYAV